MSDPPSESAPRRSLRILERSPERLSVPSQASLQHLPTSPSPNPTSSQSESQASFHSASSVQPTHSASEIPFGSPYYPHVSPASPSQFSTPNITAPSAVPVNLFRPSPMMYSVPESIPDPESLSVSTGGDKYDIVSARSVNVSLPAPSFLNTPHTHHPHHYPQIRNAYDRYFPHYYSPGRPQPPMIHPSSLSLSQNSIPGVINPISSPEPSTSQSSISINTNSIGLEILQTQLNQLQYDQRQEEHEHMKKEEENKMLLQQVLQAQQHIASIYDKVVRLESENKDP